MASAKVQRERVHRYIADAGVQGAGGWIDPVNADLARSSRMWPVAFKSTETAETSLIRPDYIIFSRFGSVEVECGSI
jgi:hypothetical protein